MRFVQNSFVVVMILWRALAAPDTRADILFESGTLGPTGVPRQDVLDQIVLGANVNNNAFVGVRLQLTQPVRTTEIGGHFVGLPDNTTFFGAVVALDGPTDFPDSNDLSTPDVLGSTLLGFPEPSAEVFGSLDLQLDPGWYALIFGSGVLSANGDGAALLNNTDIGSPDYIGFLSGFGWGRRLPGKRFVVNGIIIPEPTSVVLAVAASFVLLSLYRHRFSCSH